MVCFIKKRKSSNLVTIFYYVIVTVYIYSWKKKLIKLWPILVMLYVHFFTFFRCNLFTHGCSSLQWSDLHVRWIQHNLRSKKWHWRYPKSHTPLESKPSIAFEIVSWLWFGYLVHEVVAIQIGVPILKENFMDEEVLITVTRDTKALTLSGK